MIIDKIADTIARYGMIEEGDGVVVGLSGGPDSVCLIHSLHALRERLGIGRLTAVHINHGLRGQESDDDEEYARKMAESLGVVFECYRYDVADVARQTGTGTEEAGRKLRYEAFEEVRKKYGAARIAVAHNMNDQAETVLMRIMRGTGIRGLGGIEHIRADGVIIRPVLDLSRNEIEQYCEENNLKPHTDSTNTMPVYTRNKIRLQLIPMMQENFNPNIMAALVRLGTQAAEDEDFIAGEALRTFEEAWCQDDRSLDAERLARLHPAVAKRVLMECMKQCGLTQNIGAQHFDIIMGLIKNGSEAREADLLQGHYVRFSYGKLWFLRRNSTTSNAVPNAGNSEDGFSIKEPVRLPIDLLESVGYAELDAGGRRLRLHVREAYAGETGLPMRVSASDSSGCCKHGEIRLDFDRLATREEPVFRNRCPGDRISPRGMKGSKKLQDFFTDRKIPKHMRDNVLLIASGNRVILAGHEVSSECPESAETRRILTIEY